VADGFYEWQKRNGGKQPYYIHLRERRPFAIAGLWERWQGEKGSVIESCTLLTTQPNDLIRPLHNRMPVILHPRDYQLWLDPSVQQAEQLKPLLRAYPPEEMETYAVSRFVNAPRNDDPRCIEALPSGENGRLPGF
jgi:putative SOS response-associated peptidase YedK